MSTISLIDEFYDAARQGAEHGIGWCLRHGVSARTLYHGKPFGVFDGFPTVGVDCIETFRDGTYQPCEGGKVVFVMPCNRWGELGQDIDDLVAWEPKAPACWWTRLGVATVMNKAAIEHARFENKPLMLQPTPWHWLKSGFQGAGILDSKIDLRTLLSGLTVAAVSFEHGKKLKARFAQHTLPAPKIVVPRKAA